MMHAKTKEKGENFGWVMALYLVGIFLGGLNMSNIAPIREIVQNYLSVDATWGIWMINIFTLAYTAAIPISGKLADHHGRKVVFITSIILFGIGSLISGLSHAMGGFTLLIVGRIIQGIGGGGIMPVATAEFGTSFPPEKRGMALGLVGGMFGIGNVLGAAVGSLTVVILGTSSWQWVFYINIPFCLFIIVAGIIQVPNHRSEHVGRIDAFGALLMVLIILLLLFGLKNLDFFDFAATFTALSCWPFILAAVVLVPLFVKWEKHVDDPVFHIEYMTHPQISLTLWMALMTGLSMMGMVFIPQFAENALKVSMGMGGLFVIVLGVFVGIVSPLSGAMIDKMGEKRVMGIGFIVGILGCAYLAFIASSHPNVVNVVVSLILIGIGMGFTVGTPLNYMMMEHTKAEDSNSALATLSLVRSIGTSIAPALMIGFVVQAGLGASGVIMQAMPDYNGTSVAALVESGEVTLPSDAQALIKKADVTTIVDKVKTIAGETIDAMPASEQVDKTTYLAQIDENAEQIQNVYQSAIAVGYRNMFLLVGLFNLIGLVLLCFYREKDGHLARDRRGSPTEEAA